MSPSPIKTEHEEEIIIIPLVRTQFLWLELNFSKQEPSKCHRSVFLLDLTETEAANVGLLAANAGLTV